MKKEFKMTKAEKIGANIKKFRIDRDETQEGFAKRLLINRSTLSLIEQGKQEPDVDLLVRILAIMNTTFEKLAEICHSSHLVVDTNIILSRPSMLNSFTSYCDFVHIPRTVIRELNTQKDKGNAQKRKLAALCLNKINELKGDNFKLENEEKSADNNDDAIFAFVKELAQENESDLIFLLTNDIDFKVRPISDIPINVRVLNSADFDEMIIPSIDYDTHKSQKFFELVKNKNLQEVKNFSVERINLNHIDHESGLTPLIQAIRNHDKNMIKHLLTLPNLDVNAVDNYKYLIPPITHAIQVHDVEIMKLLIENGANVNAPSQNERNPFNTPLMVAAWEENLKAVKLLAESGACINQQDKGNGFTPLIKAVFKNRSDIVKYLLEKGADRNVYSFERKSALDYAYERNNKEIINLLKSDYDR